MPVYACIIKRIAVTCIMGDPAGRPGALHPKKTALSRKKLEKARMKIRMYDTKIHYPWSSNLLL